MSDTQKMIEAARGAMINVLALTPKDRVLVVTDRKKQPIGDAFHEAAASVGCRVETYSLPERERPLAEVPHKMSEALAGKTVVVNAFEAMGEETPFRIKWIFEIQGTGQVRLGHAPGITEAMMLEGPMNVDYAAMNDSAHSLMQAFENAVSTRITTPAGTDLVLDIEDRAFQTDVKATVKMGSNLPCGEIYCAPVETGADGMLVIDGSIGDIGNVTHPIRITIEKGKITGIESDSKELVARVEELTGLDGEASVIGELGIGLNPGAKLTGNMLEDEKAFRTAHIAFGNNSDMPGGRNGSKTHRDFLFYNPTIVVTYKDGSQRTLLEDGNITL